VNAVPAGGDAAVAAALLAGEGAALEYLVNVSLFLLIFFSDVLVFSDDKAL
jgi:hypothetical protein